MKFSILTTIATLCAIAQAAPAEHEGHKGNGNKGSDGKSSKNSGNPHGSSGQQNWGPGHPSWGEGSHPKPSASYTVPGNLSITYSAWGPSATFPTASLSGWPYHTTSLAIPTSIPSSSAVVGLEHLLEALEPIISILTELSDSEKAALEQLLKAIESLPSGVNVPSGFPTPTGI
ncbi:hypothetical protein PSN45_001185 [Yamadazyma tenuis]|uniref:Uncharacterized protein n=1 Tax=Candida tenuis (strain ATCC 10573 / BCRC 21748 / CBS 615 / JCM 9827 / NBRC 10315 / NRRL Y-1498 / VKM Y-70) TaxID=590646 RepID=G3B8U8_CANTC|nr:uncharacterized protein CANTEDRAFT_95328 [Yamadazyma tenuis ATCC 10573]EGV62430.1 hypothetical protein CANTEDRAFT_95328 [Yamadazyma tenuis ATCC 10573]WEJ93713.1 hypothetical protein PSN45_001185 [Yamadazyma tenuis]